MFGALDPAFGDGGRVTTDFPGESRNDAGADLVAMQADGTIVVAGSTTGDEDTDFGLARYHADGRLDGDFRSGGRVTTDFGSSLEFATGLVLQVGDVFTLDLQYSGRNWPVSQPRSTRFDANRWTS